MTGAARPASWVIYGCRTPYAAEVAEILWRGHHTIACLVDNLPDGPLGTELGEPIRPTDLDARHRPCPVVVPLLTPGHRAQVEHEATALGLTRFPALIDPSAVVARRVELDLGVVVNAASVIGASAELGRFVHVNRSASIGHHNVIGDYVTFGPGCVLAGSVRVGAGAFIGAGAVIAPGVTVGANAVVGAGAVVVKDVPDLAVVVGNPASVLRLSTAGYGGVSVPVGAVSADQTPPADPA